MIELLLVVWVVLLVMLLAFAIGRPYEGGALTLAYFLGLSLIHVPGVFPFVFSDSVPFLYASNGFNNPEATQIGFELTVLGMAAFCGGAVIARISDRRRLPPAEIPARRRADLYQNLGWRETAAGAVGYFGLLPLAQRVPSLGSLIAPLATLLIIGLWVILYGALREGDCRRVWITMPVLPLLPLATLVTAGFIGYGVYWALSVLAFLYVVVRRRGWFYFAGPLIVYLGLSLFVTYMGQRTGIREVVWDREAGIAERLERVSTIITDFKFLDLGSSAHISALDGRLNQNVLVGLAVEHLQGGWVEFAYGATVPLWSLVPRAVWPGKPEVGGGRSLVSDYTGLTFNEETSVGAGQVLEFYVNFGIPGVVIGFVLLGFGLLRLDQRIMQAMGAEDMRRVLLRSMPGLTLLQPGGNLLEIFVSAVAAVLIANLLARARIFHLPGAADAAGTPG